MATLKNTVEGRKQLAAMNVASFLLRDSVGGMESGAGELSSLFFAGWSEAELMAMGFFQKPEEPWAWLEERRNTMEEIKVELDEKGRCIILIA